MFRKKIYQTKKTKNLTVWFFYFIKVFLIKAPGPISTPPYLIGGCAASAADRPVAQKAHTCHSDMARYCSLSAEGGRNV
jgi:hypothetical protein